MIDSFPLFVVKENVVSQFISFLGELLPLDFEIQGGRDERLIDGVTGIVIKEIKDSSVLQQKSVRVGDHILKV